MPVNHANYADDPAAAPVLAALERGKWRKARDFAKQLCKKERDRYLPLVIQANVGLCRDMIAKRQLSEAGIVLEHLRTIADEAVCQELAARLEQAESGDVDALVSHAPDASERVWREVLESAGRLEAGEESVPDSAWLAADALAAGKAEPPPGGDGEPLGERVREELQAVRQARDATAEGDWEEARTLLRRVPARSIFRHWRLFLRGVRHWFQDEETAARQCFERLPAGSACARAAAAIAGEGRASGIDRGSLARWWIASSGAGNVDAQAIAKIEAAWAAGSWRRPFDQFGSLMGAYWQRLDGALPALWARLLFPPGLFETEGESRRARELDQFADNFRGRGKKAPGLYLSSVCPAALLIATDDDDDELALVIREMGRSAERVFGPNPVRENVLCRWLADWAAEFQAFSFLMPPRPRDAALAREMYEQALQHDPDDLQSALELVAFLGDTGEKARRNRLLDDLSLRFPEEKRVLRLAGRLAAERGAFPKSIKFLESAHRADPLDPGVRADLVQTYLQLIRKRRTQGRDAKKEWELVEGYAFDHPSGEALWLSRWSLRLRRAVMNPNSRQAADWLEEARKLAPHRAECLLLEHCLRAGHEERPSRAWEQAWRAVPCERIADLERLIGVIDHVAKDPAKGYAQAEDFCRPIREKFKQALPRLLEEAPMEARRLYQTNEAGAERHAFGPGPDLSRYVRHVLRAEMDEALMRISPKSKKLHPALKLLHLQNQLRHCGLAGEPEALLQAADLIDEASERGLPEIAEEARRLHQSLMDGDAAPWPFDPDLLLDDGDDEGEDAEEDDDEEIDFVADLFDPESLPITFVAQLLDAVNANDAGRLKELRLEAPQHGVPPDLINMEVLRMVFRGDPGVDRPPPPPRKSRKAHKEEPPDNQLDLPF